MGRQLTVRPPPTDRAVGRAAQTAKGRGPHRLATFPTLPESRRSSSITGSPPTSSSVTPTDGAATPKLAETATPLRTSSHSPANTEPGAKKRKVAVLKEATPALLSPRAPKWSPEEAEDATPFSSATPMDTFGRPAAWTPSDAWAKL
eukprot:9057266-Heterocapsa_arctica.AAC.1